MRIEIETLKRAKRIQENLIKINLKVELRVKTALNWHL